MRNKLATLIALAAAVHATSLQAGIFSFLKGRPKPREDAVQAAPSGSEPSNSKARTEARLDQHGSIMRTGANTAARVTENGSVSLSRGVVLISSGEGLLRRPPVQISTPQGDVTVRGSAIVAALPDGSVKMTVLEGHAKGALGGKEMALDPGQLMIQRHETRDAVKVDLGALTASSLLLNRSGYNMPLSAAPQIQNEVMQQVQALGGATPLNGHQVTDAAALKMAKNAETSNTGGTLGGTLQIGGSNQGGSTHAVNLAYSGSADLSHGTLSGSSLTTATGPFLSVSTPPSLPGPGQSSSPSLVVSGSSIVLSGGSGISVNGLNSLTLNTNPQVSSGTLQLSGASNTPPESTSGGHHLSGSTLAISGAYNAVSTSDFSAIRSSSGTLTLTPGTFGNGSSVVIGSQAALGGVISLTLSTGSTLVLKDGAAQQFLNGSLTITGAGGVVLTPSSSVGE